MSGGEPDKDAQGPQEGQRGLFEGNGRTTGAAPSLTHFVGPTGHISRRPAAALTAQGLAGEGLQQRPSNLAPIAMNTEPPLRITLMPEKAADAKDWYGFLNIKLADVPTWIKALQDENRIRINNLGEEELTFCLAGFNKTAGLPEKGIRIEQKLGAKQIEQIRRDRTPRR